MNNQQIIALSAAEAAAAVLGGELDSRELLAAYHERAREHGGADALNCFAWLPEEPQGRSAPASPLGGVPLAVKDLFCTEGVPSQSGSKILAGYRPPYTATAVAKLQQAGRGVARQDQPGRVRDGLLDRELRVRADDESVGPRRVPGGSSGGSAAAVAAGLAPGRSAQTRAARSASRRRSAASSA